MKRIIAVALAITFVCSFVPSQADASLGVFATWWDGDETDSGFGGGAKFEFPLIPIVSLDVRASYISWNPDGVDGLYTIPLEVVGSLTFGLFYGGLSLGYYVWGASDYSASDEVGGSIFAGVSLGLGSIGAFGELRYNSAKTTLSLDELELGEAKADGFSINLGVKF